ncbi:fumarylacetoacetate hydrolase family protein [Roseovarius nubinhibens]|uniref:Fumarylacetoacetase n=1 Tax=Roseovarius nubinhibens TaxID=314263 RepID=A0A348WHN4_9RHOB|nr:fumarylacetoacetase [Roseovarius nubinhibens]
MSDKYLFAPEPQASVAVKGRDERFPVRRIFCVGRNYAAHAAEMGNEVDREAPFYFTKSPHGLCPSGAEIAYPSGTEDCHHEMEFVVALGGDIAPGEGAAGMAQIVGYGCGIDLTRRDLQGQAKDKRRPWDLGKDFENAAIMGVLTEPAEFGAIGEQAITLDLDGVRVQEATLAEMVHSVPEVLSHLSRFYRLGAGDLIYTGTPAGVGPVKPGSHMLGRIDGLEPVELRIKA